MSAGEPRHGGPPFTAEAVMIEMSKQEGIWSDEISYLGSRIAALEEALVSRRARRRLRRVYRQADRDYAWAGENFRDRRIEACGDDQSLYGWLGGPAIGGPAAGRTYWPLGKPRHGGGR